MQRCNSGGDRRLQHNYKHPQSLIPHSFKVHLVCRVFVLERHTRIWNSIDATEMVNCSGINIAIAFNPCNAFMIIAYHRCAGCDIYIGTVPDKHSALH